MIIVQWNGRLGNQLFEYAIGRILAEELGYELISDPLPGFIGTYEAVPGRRIVNPLYVFQGNILDLNFIRNNKGSLGYGINGWFQRYEYYRDHKDRIKKWFRIDPVFSPRIDPEDVVVHVRRTQDQLDFRVPYEINGQSIMMSPDLLSFEWYDSILSSMPFKRMYICTDVRTDPFLTHFKKFDPIITDYNTLQDYTFMTRFNRIVTSMSTYSWWAGWLSEASEVYLPRPDYGAWSKPEMNFNIDEGLRFRFKEAIRAGTFI